MAHVLFSATDFNMLYWNNRFLPGCLQNWGVEVDGLSCLRGTSDTATQPWFTNWWQNIKSTTRQCWHKWHQPESSLWMWAQQQFGGRSSYSFPWAGKGMPGHCLPKQGSCPRNSHLFNSGLLFHKRIREPLTPEILKSSNNCTTLSLLGSFGSLLRTCRKEIIVMSEPLHSLVPTQILDDLEISSMWQMKTPQNGKKKKNKIKLSPTQALTDFSNLISSSAVSV